MKKFGYLNSAMLAICMLLFAACDGVFVPDPIDPRLPKFTEDGNNVAGAMINDQVWKSQVKIDFPYIYNEPYIIASSVKDSLVVRFWGNTSWGNSSIEFHLTGINVHKFEDLTNLNDQKIELDGEQNSGYYIESHSSSVVENKGIGQVYFTNATANDSVSVITLSGTFGFTVPQTNGNDIKVTYGRFDYRVSSSLFMIE